MFDDRLLLSLDVHQVFCGFCIRKTTFINGVTHRLCGRIETLTVVAELPEASLPGKRDCVHARTVVAVVTIQTHRICNVKLTDAFKP